MQLSFKVLDLGISECFISRNQSCLPSKLEMAKYIQIHQYGDDLPEVTEMILKEQFWPSGAFPVKVLLIPRIYSYGSFSSQKLSVKIAKIGSKLLKVGFCSDFWLLVLQLHSKQHYLSALALTDKFIFSNS